MGKVINKIFELLEDWGNLPAYQLERRADIFFAYFLPDIFKAEFYEEEITIVPEFPLRRIDKNGKKTDYRPVHVDYAVFGKKLFYLVELKTEMGSRRGKQDKYLQCARDRGFAALISEIEEFAKRSRKPKKYECLNKKLAVLNNGYVDVKVVYIQPCDDKSPNKTDKDETGYETITFANIIKYLPETALANRFAKFLGVIESRTK
jgi:hypothetical protein